ncbi:hypothetical protein HDR61_03785 [bacterium]|nr:hypothetical protein [bacterium]
MTKNICWYNLGVSERCLKEAFKMTDKVNGFSKAMDTMGTMQRVAGYRRGMAAVNLADAFGRRGITFGGMDGFPGQIEK